MSSVLNNYLTNTCSVQICTGYSYDGDLLLSDAIDIKCRVYQLSQEQVIEDNKISYICTARIVTGRHDITFGSIITYANTKYKVVKKCPPVQDCLGDIYGYEYMLSYIS